MCVQYAIIYFMYFDILVIYNNSRTNTDTAQYLNNIQKKLIFIIERENSSERSDID
jgi:hypothetical protein